ncbi:MAG: chromate resistance protein [Nitrospirota bacterium]|nr:chromate resistance protein [Nitrospirota bacterium]
MHNTSRKTKQTPQWLLFFYSVPSRPVSSRMRIWRKLAKAGAVQMKGAVYILPFNDEHYEFLQWLVSEIAGMKGEAAVVSIEKIDTMKDEEIVAFFDQQRARDYKTLQKPFDDLGRRLSSIQKGAKPQNVKSISDQFTKLQKEFGDIKRIDFFSSQEGAALGDKIKHIHADLKIVSGTETRHERPAALSLKTPADYQNKTWITRKRPFIDRMASAWLIRRFIDRDAAFDFVDEKDMDSIEKRSVTFDIRGGEFTHSGDMCTFEVIMKSFGLRDKTLKKMAEIIHDLDMKDDKFNAVEAKGMEHILEGIRRTAKNDLDALEKGMTIFEMLYASKG